MNKRIETDINKFMSDACAKKLYLFGTISMMG